MPKLIPHLADTILEKASLLFSRLGYSAVDMKQVAVESGTSVGNLYNYYPSKPELFLAISKRWRASLVGTCSELLASEGTRRERILSVLGRLYEDISRWQGLWAEYLARDDNTDGSKPRGRGIGTSPDEETFLGDFEALLAGHSQPGGPHRWATLLITATVQLAKRHPEDREGNWKFLETLVDKI